MGMVRVESIEFFFSEKDSDYVPELPYFVGSIWQILGNRLFREEDIYKVCIKDSSDAYHENDWVVLDINKRVE